MKLILNNSTLVLGTVEKRDYTVSFANGQTRQGVAVEMKANVKYKIKLDSLPSGVTSWVLRTKSPQAGDGSIICTFTANDKEFEYTPSSNLRGLYIQNIGVSNTVRTANISISGAEFYDTSDDVSTEISVSPSSAAYDISCQIKANKSYKVEIINVGLNTNNIYLDSNRSAVAACLTPSQKSPIAVMSSTQLANLWFASYGTLSDISKIIVTELMDN